MKKGTKLLLVFIPILIVAVIIAIAVANNVRKTDGSLIRKTDGSLRTVSSKSELLKLTESQKLTSEKEKEMLYQLGPLYFIMQVVSGELFRNNRYYPPVYETYETDTSKGGIPIPYAAGSVPSGMQSSSPTISFGTEGIRTNTEDYSKTNTQVENVDEADIIKTDGKYVYSLTADKIVITNVEDLSKPEVVGKVTIEDSTYIPEDLVLYNDYLIAIGTKSTTSYSYRNNATTGVFIYDMKDKKNRRKLKNSKFKKRITKANRKSKTYK